MGEAALWGGTGRLEPGAGAEAEAESLSEGISAVGVYGARGMAVLLCVLGETREERPGAAGAGLLFWGVVGVLMQLGSGLTD